MFSTREHLLQPGASTGTHLDQVDVCEAYGQCGERGRHHGPVLCPRVCEERGKNWLIGEPIEETRLASVR